MPTRSRRSHLGMRYGGHRRRKVRFRNSLESIVIYTLSVVFMIVLIIVIKNILSSNSNSTNIKTSNVAAFAIPYKTIAALRTLSTKYNIEFPEILTIYSLENSFYPLKSTTPPVEDIEQNFIVNYEKIKKQYSAKKINSYYQMFKTVLEEIKYFPIMTGYDGEAESTYTFSDSYGSARKYGSEREHEGTDILDRENIRGRIPVATMTDGVIEDLGWNELGGFRVGVRTKNDTYYYYAHLDSFVPNLIKGMNVSAGNILGFMGDTGYGKKEGTKGNFPVHLHVGISPKVQFTNSEFWLNPYPFLRLMEETKITYIKVN